MCALLGWTVCIQPVVGASKCVDVRVDVGSFWTRCAVGVLPVCGV